MATITALQSTDNGSTSMSTINTNFTNLNSDKLESSQIATQSEIATGWVAAGETWTYASADDPTFTFTISGDQTTKYSAGMRIKLTQTTAKYFLITAVAYSAPNTTVTVYGGTDYDLANAAITLPYFSTQKAPFGFPLDPTKWTVKVIDTSERVQNTPTQNTWYNLGSVSISIPIGIWNVDYQATGYFDDTTSTILGDFYTTLSTANNSASDNELTTFSYQYVNSSVSGSSGGYYSRSKQLVLASKTSYYLNAKTAQAGVANIRFANNLSNCVIRAVSAYL